MTNPVALKPIPSDPQPLAREAGVTNAAALRGSPTKIGIAHHHLLSIVHSELATDQASVSILDVGCGDGVLLGFLYDRLRHYRPKLALSLYGFDVSDSGVQELGFLDGTIQYLNLHAPEVDWRHRIRCVRSTDPWPFEDGSFDFVISNHVLEHVGDHGLFFHETCRVLKKGGKSAHLFPLKHCLYERHLNLPIVQHIRDHDALRGYIKMTSWLGMGKYRLHQQEIPGITRDRYAERQADYMTYFTNYLTKKQVLDFAQRSRLRPSFRYSEHFYTNRARVLLGKEPKHQVRAARHGMLHSVFVFLLMWISSITLFLEKKQVYRDVELPSS